MKLHELDLVDLDANVSRYLPFTLSHPQFPDTPITLRMLMEHTAGIKDSKVLQLNLAPAQRPLLRAAAEGC
jgi:CubicO group peptidase (beta-lactamase class C family)